MTVEELIELLCNERPDAEVFIPSQTGGWYSCFGVEKEDDSNTVRLQ